VSDLQPPPLQCQWCGRDLEKTTHAPTCRVVVEVDELTIPDFLRRKKAAGGHTPDRASS